ncbi:MAG: hypothetical protein EP298_11395 [Gammaproteobacteria bacterium]|nr:MAG: hypothetical protein EP298_11395 [Gammaproteobacteria bacterium]UTW43222.1 DUF5617 domain-containing protein [bacterium SCSIO 12844]
MYIEEEDLYDLKDEHPKAEGSHGKVYLLDGQAIKVSKDGDENIRYECDIFNQLQSKGIVQGKAEVVQVQVDKGNIVNALMTPWLEGKKPTAEQIIETLSSMKEAGYIMADPISDNFKVVDDKAVPIDFDKVFHKDNRFIPESILSGIIHDIDTAVMILNKNRAPELAKFYVQHKPKHLERDRNSIPSFLNGSNFDEYSQEESQEEVVAKIQERQQLEHPRSYERIYNRGSNNVESTPKEKIENLLRDYCNKGTGFSAFFHGHWKRHHVESIRQFMVDNADVKDINQYIFNLKTLRTRLEEQEGFNGRGSISKRMNFIFQEAGSGSSKSQDISFRPNLFGK